MVVKIQRNKSILQKILKRMTAKFMLILAYCNLFCMSVYAAPGDDQQAATGVDAVTAPLTNLQTLLTAVIGAVGAIIFLKNIMEFAQAYQQQDSSTMHAALKGIVAGILMMSITAVRTFLGI